MKAWHTHRCSNVKTTQSTMRKETDRARDLPFTVRHAWSRESGAFVTASADHALRHGWLVSRRGWSLDLAAPFLTQFIGISVQEGPRATTGYPTAQSMQEGRADGFIALGHVPRPTPAPCTRSPTPSPGHRAPHGTSARAGLHRGRHPSTHGSRAGPRANKRRAAR